MRSRFVVDLCYRAVTTASEPPRSRRVKHRLFQPRAYSACCVVCCSGRPRKHVLVNRVVGEVVEEVLDVALGPASEKFADYGLRVLHGLGPP